MGRSGSSGGSCIQLLPLPGCRRITICTHVWQGSHHPICKTARTSPKVLGRLRGPPENGFIKETLFADSRERETSKRRRDPAETTKQENIFKVNDLVLVRDVTSGTFTPRYMPNYRVVEIHRPNRTIVRDEKGIERVRRSSHLKACEPKDKVAAMIPDAEGYRQFGRNTKLLLHPKDVPDLQFSPATEKRGEIPPEIEISMVNVITKQEIAGGTDLANRGGEISPENTVKTPVTNVCSKFIVDGTRSLLKYSEISPEAPTKEKIEKSNEKRTWFQNPVNCVSKWSKALEMGVVHSMGLDTDHTANVNQRENDKHDFSFFL